VTGSGLAILPGNEQKHESGVAPGVARIAPGTDAPAPPYRERYLRLVALAYGGKRDRDDFRPRSSLEPLHQGIQRCLSRGIEQAGKVVDVADRLSREQCVYLRALRPQRHGRQLKRYQEGGSFGTCCAQSVSLNYCSAPGWLPD
jgi:hypothetical protein